MPFSKKSTNKSKNKYLNQMALKLLKKIIGECSAQTSPNYMNYVL